MKKKNIINYNTNGQRHGYHECYYSNGDSYFIRTTFKNGLSIGYCENHATKQTRYHIR